jgi:hypothetical protein
MKKIKTIDLDVKEWFDRINGNSYLSAKLTINYGMKDQRVYAIPFQYGYGSAPELEAAIILTSKEKIKAERYIPLSYFCRENGIIYRYGKQENCKKKDVISFGQE